VSDPLLHVGAQVSCPHQGQATDASSNLRVRVSGMAVATVADQFTVVGCSFQVPVGAGTKPQPCVRIQWLKPALRVKVNGSPVLLQSSAGVCQSAEQIPQGPPMAAATQVRVRGMSMTIDHPFHFDPRGAAATTDDDDHLRDMLEQLLLTSPGERVNRPDFGCGLLRQVFEPNSPELAAGIQFTVQASILRWLGDVIEPQAVEIVAEDSALHVTVRFARRSTGERKAETFSWGVGS